MAAATPTLAAWLERLKQGDVEFYTRFQEEEWGCRYLGLAGFLVWRRNSCAPDYHEELKSEVQVARLFARYSSEKLWQSLIPSEKIRPNRPHFS